MKRTPGPYDVSVAGIYGSGLCIARRHPEERDDKLWMRNADFLVRAANSFETMLAALKECESFLEDQHDAGLDVPELKTVRAAIRKAEGRAE